MPVYLLYGFRWPRAGFTGIRVYIVLHNLEDSTAEYLQNPVTSRQLINSFKKRETDIMDRLPDLQFIEQYDPDDTTSETAVSQPHAYVAGRVIEIPDHASPGSDTGFNTADLDNQPGLPEPASGALTELRDKLAAGERIGWFIVYNGDPERYYPGMEEEYTDEEDGEDDGYDNDANGNFKDGSRWSSVCSLLI